MSYSVAKMPREIIIGRETENGVTQIRFDVSPWLEKWPGMCVSMIARNPEGTVYIPATAMDLNELVWSVTSADTAVPGTGSVEIVGTLDEKKKISAASDTKILGRIEGTTGEPPEYAGTWIDQINAAGDKALTAADNAEKAAQAAETQAAAAQEAANQANQAALNANNQADDAVGRVNQAIENLQSAAITVDQQVTEGSANAVSGGAVKTYVDGKVANKETWTFTLADGTTVEKQVILA